jgi:hypothetical protein
MSLFRGVEGVCLGGWVGFVACAFFLGVGEWGFFLYKQWWCLGE